MEYAVWKKNSGVYEIIKGEVRIKEELCSVFVSRARKTFVLPNRNIFMDYHAAIHHALMLAEGDENERTR